MQRHLLLLLFMVATACYAQTCAKLDTISQTDADAFWPGSAPNTIVSPNITDNRVRCGGNTPHAYYKDKDGNIRLLYVMICADGKWEVDYAISYNTTQVACVGNVILCPALGLISQKEADAEWAGSAPNVMSSPTQQKQWFVCSGNTTNFHWKSSEGTRMHKTDRMVCSNEGKWLVDDGKHETVGFIRAACLGETIRAKTRKCIRPENISHDELEYKMPPGLLFSDAHIKSKEASCKGTRTYLVYEKEDRQFDTNYATRMRCQKNGEWLIAGPKGDKKVFEAPKISCMRRRPVS